MGFLFVFYKTHDRILLLALPAIITILIAGPYCAVYSVVLILSYAFACLSGRLKNRYCIAGVVSVVLPLLLYMWSNSYAYEDHDGAIKISLVEMFLERPEFFPNFLVRSMASMVVRPWLWAHMVCTMEECHGCV